MGSKGGSAPTPPDPQETAQAQSQYNIQTAMAQQAMNMVGQNNPWGSSTYNQTGTQTITGPDGESVEVPQYTQNVTLSPEQQRLYETGTGTQQNLANLAQEQSGRLSGLLNEPLDWSQQQNFLNDLTTQQLDPVWERQQEQQQTDLLNRGVMPGSTAYQRAMDDFQRSRSSSYNDALLDNYTTAQQSQMALRNQPLNEIIGLSSGSQVQQPQFGQTPQTGVGGTDYAGLAQNQYQGQLAAWQQQQQAQQGLLGGLFGLGAAGIMSSDRRVKTNVKRIGRTPGGYPLYEFNYVWGGPKHLGVMAQDVMKTNPGAVLDIDGMLFVNYGMID